MNHLYNIRRALCGPYDTKNLVTVFKNRFFLFLFLQIFLTFMFTLYFAGISVPNPLYIFYTHSIPHIIHQSWKTHNTSGLDGGAAHFPRWQKTWQDNHPTWTYRLWSDDENRELVRLHYPHLLEFYDAIPKPIMRVDFVRPLYLHYYGGVYADLDVESIQPLDDFFADSGKDVILGRMESCGSDGIYLEHGIPNAFMASVPGHPFWMHLIQNSMDRGSKQFVEGFAGPVALKYTYDKFQKEFNDSRVWAADSKYFFPYSWNCNGYPVNVTCPRWQDEEYHMKCLQALPESYTITYWSHTWGEQAEYPHNHEMESVHGPKLSAKNMKTYVEVPMIIFGVICILSIGWLIYALKRSNNDTSPRV